eukprot:m.62922 g.62922  ORF g.62922 m.62922 type:complete len:286 (+) comp11544_c0_seq2:849-1706(+)
MLMGKLQLQCGSRSFLYKRFSWLNNQLELIDVHLLYVAGPQLAVTHPDVKILAQDDNKELTLHYAKAMFTDPEVSKFVAGLGLHWYTGDWFDEVELVSKMHSDKLLIATEACVSPGAVYDSWSRGFKYAHDIMGDLQAGVHGWVDWNLVLMVQNCTNPTEKIPCITGPNHADPVGDDAPIIVDTVLQKIHYQVPYFVIGHFSRYVQPGDVRVTCNLQGDGDSNALSCVAFLSKESKRVTVILLNSGDEEIKFNLNVTDSNLKSQNPSSISPHSIQTIVVPDDLIP